MLDFEENARHIEDKYDGESLDDKVEEDKNALVHNEVEVNVPGMITLIMEKL